MRLKLFSVWFSLTLGYCKPVNISNEDEQLITQMRLNLLEMILMPIVAHCALSILVPVMFLFVFISV